MQERFEDTKVVVRNCKSKRTDNTMATRKRTKGQTTDTFTKAYILFMSAAGIYKNQIIQNKRHRQ
jgi:hypothetical protein